MVSSQASTRAATAINKDPYPSTYRPYPGAPTALVGATVFDGAGGRIDNGTVLLADGKVVAIFPGYTAEYARAVARPDLAAYRLHGES